MTATAASNLAPVRIHTEGSFGPDWIATCRLCNEQLLAGDWGLCMEFALGHLGFRHPGWWKSRCDHEFAAHSTSRSWCLDCGTDLT